MQRVFVLDKNRQALMLCTSARARELLRKGIHRGRIAIRFRPSFRLNGFDVHPKYLTLIHQADGYAYTKETVRHSPPG